MKLTSLINKVLKKDSKPNPTVIIKVDNLGNAKHAIIPIPNELLEEWTKLRKRKRYNTKIININLNNIVFELELKGDHYIYLINSLLMEHGLRLCIEFPNEKYKCAVGYMAITRTQCN